MDDRFARDIIPVLIQDEMKSSYMDYSMSVIIGRALPDVRDGLKPVHRRILFAMREMGLRHDRRYVKCAGVVGEVLKKYHPHGDSAVYDALARLAQPWNLRYMLVDGQGNFGSVDGDPPAAYRYTECKMTRLAEELLVDIDEETVDFEPNFDGTVDEPLVLPSAYPNLLVNGTDGIAVGMATKIPPHNLGEIVDAAIALIDDPELGVEDLLRIVPGPDFPTAGTIHGRAGIREAYTTGRGRVVVRGRAFIEDMDGGRQRIVIDELPYQVNKSRLLESIVELYREKRIDGISALRDESDRTGMRIVVELKRDAFAEVVLNHLYKHTALQSTFGVILLAIVGQRPRILTLKEMLQHYIGHRREVVLRRSRFRLRKARERLHLVEGFLRALDMIDAVIATIRGSQTVDDARQGLQAAPFDFSEVQAQAILDMRLQRLTGMERDKLETEAAELHGRIEALETILGSEEALMGVVKDELLAVRAAYADPRRTRIEDAAEELTVRDLVAEEDQVVTLSHLGYIKRCRPDEWRMQKRGGTGKRGMATREADFVTSLFLANTHDHLLVFTEQGNVLPLPVWTVPEAPRDAKGRPIVNLLNLPDGERVAAVVGVRDLHDVVEDDPRMLVFVSRQGLVKRTPLSAFRHLRTNGMRAVGISDDDALLVVRLVDDADVHLMLFSDAGKCIRFPLADVPEYGRTARGNLGMKLGDDDMVIDAVIAPATEVDPTDSDDDELDDLPPVDDTADTTVDADDEPWQTTLLTVTSLGYGTRTPFGAYRVQGRNGKGILSFRCTDKTGPVVGAVEVSPADQLMIVTDTGRVIRFLAGSVRITLSRNVQGVRLMRLADGERVVDVERLEDVDEEAVEAVDTIDADDVLDAIEADDVLDATEVDEDDGSDG